MKNNEKQWIETMKQWKTMKNNEKNNEKQWKTMTSNETMKQWKTMKNNES